MGLLDSFLGILIGGGTLLSVTLLGNFLLKKDSMGGGDIKLIAMIGAFLGWESAIFAFLFSPFPALPVGLYMRIVKKRETIPFGPYIAMMGAIFFFYGDSIWSYILRY